MTFLDQLKVERQMMVDRIFKIRKMITDSSNCDDRVNGCIKGCELAIAAFDGLIEAYKKELELMENDLGRW